MDYLYQKSINFENIKLKNLVVLKNNLSAQLYMLNLYSYYTDVVIYSEDNQFPENKNFSNYIREQIEINEKLNILIIGSDSMCNMKIKSDKIFILDDVLLSDFDISTKNKINFDSEKIQILIRSFFEQDKKRKLGYNFSNHYLNSMKYKNQPKNWIFEMLVGSNEQNL
jgi:hypothetical protein